MVPTLPTMLKNIFEHSADAVIIGEGEQTLAEICDQVIRKGKVALDTIHGVAFKKTVRFRALPDGCW